MCKFASLNPVALRSGIQGDCRKAKEEGTVHCAPPPHQCIERHDGCALHDLVFQGGDRERPLLSVAKSPLSAWRQFAWSTSPFDPPAVRCARLWRQASLTPGIRQWFS
jgi:hypothetical protein